MFPKLKRNIEDEQYNTKRRFLNDLSNFIPIGSFVAKSHDHRLEGEHFSDETWLESAMAMRGINNREEHFQALSILLASGWIRIFAKVFKEDPNLVTVRVYVLPDDVGRRYIDRNIPTLNPARLGLKELMLSIDLSAEAWEGDMVGKAKRTIVDSKSKKGPGAEDSLFYLFNTISSPAPTTSYVQCQYSRVAMSSLLDSTSKLDGLRTELYSYQKRSAATMIRREAEPAHVLDPRLEAFEGPVGAAFYYDKETGVLLRDRRTYEEARGGYLSETMGFGKTLICLATVLATKGHWPRVPPEYSTGRDPIRREVGRLAEMAAAAVGRDQIPWRAFFQDLSRAGEHHENSISLLEHNIGSYVIPPPPSGRTRGPSKRGQTIRLCTATLIVVPLNLFTQWQNEMETHLEPAALNILSVQALDTPMPSEDEILTCDVILISKQRFERELKPLEVKPTASKKTIKCICPSTDRDCNCAAAGPNYHSSLRNLHFLRIIVDEGHDFASSGGTNNAIWALKRLQVDRRWIVSGTPSTGLLGVEVGLAVNETSSSTESSDVAADLEARNKETVRIHEYQSPVPLRSSDMTLRTQASARLQEHKDLQKLGRIVVDFLGLRPWANTRGEDPASWQKYVLPAKDGSRKPRSLKSILESLVVRHRIEDIEKDITLPALHNRVVYLEPSWHDKLSINLFLFVLTANAVTSERCDQDYMFHPKNRGQLNTLITNLRQSGFYWSSFAPEEVAKTVEVSRKYLDEEDGKLKKGSGRKDGDMERLQYAIKVGQTALKSPSWSSIGLLHELGLFVEDFPTEAREAWSLVQSGVSEPLLVGASQLAKAQQFVDSRLYASNPEAKLIEEGKALMQSAWHKVAGNGQPGSRVQGEIQDRSKTLMTDTRISYGEEPKLLSKHTLSKARKGGLSPGKRDQNTLTPPKPSPSEGESNGKRLKSALKTPSDSSFDTPPLADSPLAKTRLCGTASAKLSYLLDRIIEVQAEEKSLIFYEGDNIAYYIAQAFERVDIRFLIYTGSLTTSRKNAYVHTFNTTDTFRVMLMDIRQAAHGLHVASASRVFFVNPVWQPNVEAQAIKRAHRIGQTRPVFVETLVLKDTLEHQMLRRRKTMTAPEHFHAEKSLLDDPIMSELIKDAKFIPFTDREANHPRHQMAPLQHPQQLFGRAGSGTVNVGNANADLIFPDGNDFEVKQRKRKSSDSFQYAPHSTLSQFSRKGREFNVHDSGDYSSTTRGHTTSFSSNLPDKGSLDGLKGSPNFSRATSIVPVPSVAESTPRKKRVGFAVDEDYYEETSGNIGASAGISDSQSYKRSASESLAPPNKRVAFSIGESVVQDQDHDSQNVSHSGLTSSQPSRLGSLFGNGANPNLPAGSPRP